MTGPVSEPDGSRPRMEAYDARRRKRADRLLHWSLDMPPDEEDVDGIRVNRGIGWRELAVVGATVLGGVWLFSGDEPTPAPVQVVQPAQPASQVDSEYEVRFYDADGNQIDVPRRSETQ